MIVDKIENAHLYYGIGENFKKGFEYLKNTDLINLKNGKYEIDGEKIFVSVQDYITKPEPQGKYEAHKKYADIQFIIKGEEKLGWDNISDFSPNTCYDEENDIVFLDKQNSSNQFIQASKDYFVVFFPEDVHMPCITFEKPSYVKKAVVKIQLD